MRCCAKRSRRGAASFQDDRRCFLRGLRRGGGGPGARAGGAAGARCGRAGRAWGRCRCAWRLHTGAREQRDGDYFGPPLNRVARLLAAAHGGQVLLSLADARSWCATHLPEGVDSARPGRAPAAGSRPAGAHLPAAGTRLPVGFSAAALAGERSPNNLPAAADQLHRPREGDGRGEAPAGQRRAC